MTWRQPFNSPARKRPAAALAGALAAKLGPIGHERPPFVEQIAASIRGFDGRSDRMGKRHFCHLTRIVRSLNRDAVTLDQPGHAGTRLLFHFGRNRERQSAGARRGDHCGSDDMLRELIEARRQPQKLCRTYGSVLGAPSNGRPYRD